MVRMISEVGGVVVTTGCMLEELGYFDDECLVQYSDWCD